MKNVITVKLYPNVYIMYDYDVFFLNQNSV